MNELQEVQEAIRSGERALQSLKEARKALDSAAGWGYVDLFGGDAISGLFKHAKVNDAQREVNEAKRDLAAFQRELSDCRDIEGLNVDIDGFLTFADFFFDGILADALVQSKINRARRDVDNAIGQVQNVLGRLERYVSGRY